MDNLKKSTILHILWADGKVTVARQISFLWGAQFLAYKPMRNLFATFVGRFLKFYADFQCCLTSWSAAQYCTLCATRSNNALKNAKRHDLWVSAVVGGLLGPAHLPTVSPKSFSIPLEQRNQSHFENITFQCLSMKPSFSLMWTASEKYLGVREDINEKKTPS